MKVPKIFSAIAAAIMLVASASVSAEPVATSFVEGVDWTKQVITVTGEGIVPPNAINYAQAKRLAATAAKADAYRKLGEMINGVRVEGETTVENMLTTQDVIKMRVSATIKGAKVISENFLSDGAYRVVVQVPLFGVSNSLANAVFDRTTIIEPFPDPIVDVAPSSQRYTSGTPVDRRIDLAEQTERTENVIPMSTTTSNVSLYSSTMPTFGTFNWQNLPEGSLTVGQPIYQQTPVVDTQAPYETPNSIMPKRSVEEYASAAQGDYTGLIVDCRGLELQPVMSPVIKNTNGTKIYGHKNLDIDRVIREGMADYAIDSNLVGRAGENPLVVKALSVENFNSNPVLSIPDSNRVLIENHATKFLKELKVVFLFD